MGARARCARRDDNRRAALLDSRSGRNAVLAVNRRDATLELLRSPIALAPMAGGPSTPALVLAASEAGAPGFLAGGYNSATQMHAEMRAVRAASERPFGVNVFVPSDPDADQERLAAYLCSLAATAERVASAVAEPPGRASAQPRRARPARSSRSCSPRFPRGV